MKVSGIDDMITSYLLGQHMGVLTKPLLKVAPSSPRYLAGQGGVLDQDCQDGNNR